MGEWAKRNRDRQNELWRNWYRQNAKRKIAWQKRRRDELRAWFKELKATLKCERCAEAVTDCLQFHHVDPSTKGFDISVGVRGCSKQRILDEIAKCIVLCANCHLKLHWEERQQRKT